MSSVSIIPQMTPEECAVRIRSLAISEHAQKLVQGLYLMHASMAFSKPAGRKGKITATVAVIYANADSDGNPGFDEWLAGSLNGLISKRTAYNYMTAAQRAGLTLEMTESQALEAANAALEKVAKLSDLYKLDAGGDGDGDGAKEPLTGDAPLVQTWLEFGATMEQLTAEESREVKALYKLDFEDLKKLQARTRRALDVIKAAAEAVRKGAR